MVLLSLPQPSVWYFGAFQRAMTAVEISSRRIDFSVTLLREASSLFLAAGDSVDLRGPEALLDQLRNTNQHKEKTARQHFFKEPIIWILGGGGLLHTTMVCFYMCVCVSVCE